MDLRVEGLDPPAQHLGRARHRGHLDVRDAGLGQLAAAVFPLATSSQPRPDSPLGQLDQAFLVVNRQQRPHGTMTSLTPSGAPAGAPTLGGRCASGSHRGSQATTHSGLISPTCPSPIGNLVAAWSLPGGLPWRTDSFDAAPGIKGTPSHVPGASVRTLEECFVVRLEPRSQLRRGIRRVVHTRDGVEGRVRDIAWWQAATLEHFGAASQSPSPDRARRPRTNTRAARPRPARWGGRRDQRWAALCLAADERVERPPVSARRIGRPVLTLRASTVSVWRHFRANGIRGSDGHRRRRGRERLFDG